MRVVRVDDTGAAGDPYEDFLADGSPAPVESWLKDEEEMLAINYTSGTTARPKGVQLTHRNIWMNAVTFALHVTMNDRDVLMHTLPMFHANGWGTPFAITGVGGRHIVLRKVDGWTSLAEPFAEPIDLAA